MSTRNSEDRSRNVVTQSSNTWLAIAAGAENSAAMVSVEARIAAALMIANQNLDSITPVHGSLVSNSGGSCR